MTKKSFKDNSANIDRFFTSTQPLDTNIKNETDETHKTHETYETHETQETHKTHYRFNLKIPMAYKQFLDDESWKEKKTITQYINDLIKQKMEGLSADQ